MKKSCCNIECCDKHKQNNNDMNGKTRWNNTQKQ